MSFARTTDTAVIIPARDEADRIETCLSALAPQCTARVQVVLVVNNTSDATAEIARGAAVSLGIDLQVLNCTFAPGLGVGEARRLGAEAALQRLPHLRYMLTTDADCRVAPDWIARSLCHLSAVDAVCGRIELLAGESDWLADLDPSLHQVETVYRNLVLEAFARHAPNCADLRGGHGETPGASLGFTREAYLTAGGFAPIPCGEDRHIIRALRTLGKQIRHAADLRVEASCRLTGRAAGGMADTLRARLSGAPYFADDCLPRAEHLIAQVREARLGCWPPQVARQDCISGAELRGNIAKLSRFLARPLPAQATALPPRNPACASTDPVAQQIYAAPNHEG